MMVLGPADSLAQVQQLLLVAHSVVVATTADGSCTVVMGGMQWEVSHCGCGWL